MLRKLWLPGLVAALAAVAIAGVSPASDSSEGPAATQGKLGIVASLTNVDVDNSHRDSVGDQLIFRLDVRDEADTQGVGTVQSVCTMTRVPGTGLTAHCVGTAEFSDGTIESAGLLHQPGRSDRFAITGGTGRYDEVDGQVTFTALNETATRLRIDLDLD